MKHKWLSKEFGHTMAWLNNSQQMIDAQYSPFRACSELVSGGLGGS